MSTFVQRAAAYKGNNKVILKVKSLKSGRSTQDVYETVIDPDLYKKLPLDAKHAITYLANTILELIPLK